MYKLSETSGGAFNYYEYSQLGIFDLIVVVLVPVVMHKDKDDAAGLHLTAFDHTPLDGEMFLQVTIIVSLHSSGHTRVKCLKFKCLKQQKKTITTQRAGRLRCKPAAWTRRGRDSRSIQVSVLFATAYNSSTVRSDKG